MLSDHKLEKTANCGLTEVMFWHLLETRWEEEEEEEEEKKKKEKKK